jgi:hypothetical protein
LTRLTPITGPTSCSSPSTAACQPRLAALEVGDAHADHHRAAVRHLAVDDAHPAAVGALDVGGVARPADAVEPVGDVRLEPLGRHAADAGRGEGAHQRLEARANLELVADRRVDVGVALVPQHQPLVGIEQREALAERLHRLGQAPLLALGASHRAGALADVDAQDDEAAAGDRAAFELDEAPVAGLAREIGRLLE